MGEVIFLFCPPPWDTHPMGVPLLANLESFAIALE